MALNSIIIMAIEQNSSEWHYGYKFMSDLIETSIIMVAQNWQLKKTKYYVNVHIYLIVHLSVPIQNITL